MVFRIPAWKGWFRLRNKECHGGHKSQSRIWWILSMYSFFLSKLNLCVIAIVTGEMCVGGGMPRIFSLQYCNDYSIPWQEKDTVCNINYGQPLSPLFKVSSYIFFILSPIPPPHFFPFLFCFSLFSISFIFLPSLSFFNVSVLTCEARCPTQSRVCATCNIVLFVFSN